ncbi:hypothetical protein GUJ93_ZPchr0010g10138 [Zizania palustris]|uniref:Uncharacterized protein n=1 Tax=Zizania palustris TaxID=103762 RepID=A0A8J6BJI8_ZIZPA|nr:hypothetical protein GUJ93_ZPchr0010g10138 [Zizania palustris]
MNRGWCSGTRPLADGITAKGYPLDSAMLANAFFALATLIFGPPTITGFTALFRKSAAALDGVLQVHLVAQSDGADVKTEKRAEEKSL